MIVQEIIFSKEECDSIINFKKRNYTNWSFRSDRNYISESITYDTTTHWIFERLTLFFEKNTGIKIINLKKEIHYHKYELGNWFSKHNDNRDKRVYSIGVILNDNFEGGDFELYDIKENIKLNKKTGNAYIFKSNIEHEITKITKGERHSLIYFLQSENVKMPILKII